MPEEARSLKHEPLIDLRLLRIFVTVGELGSMTAAARALGLTQSAVSQSIRQLEEELRVTLIVREHRPLSLTFAGNVLRQKAQRLLVEAHQIPRLLEELGKSKLSEVRIGMVDSFAATIGPSLIKELLSSAVHLTVWAGLSPSLTDALLRRSVDLIVTTDALDEAAALERYPLMKEPFILLLPIALAKRNSKPALDYLAANYPLIRYSARSHIGGQIEQHLRRIGLDAPRGIEIDTSDALTSMVAGDLGWAITTPLCLSQGRAHAERVRAVPLPSPGFGRVISLVSRSDEYRELPQKVAVQARRFLKAYYRSEIRRLAPWLTNELVFFSD